VRYSLSSDDARSTITANGLLFAGLELDRTRSRSAPWTPGSFGRFGALDPTDGGFTSRYSLSYGFERKARRRSVQGSIAYAKSSRNLIST
jgi:hypothetical protein